jgi:hypothetical protein
MSITISSTKGEERYYSFFFSFPKEKKGDDLYE